MPFLRKNRKESFPSFSCSCDFIFVGGDVRSLKHPVNLSQEANTVATNDSYDILLYKSIPALSVSSIVLSSFFIPVLWIPGNVPLLSAFHGVA